MMINLILIIAVLFGCPLEDTTIDGRQIKLCSESSLTIESARIVGPFMTGPDEKWSNFIPISLQYVTITHTSLEDFFFADYNCLQRGHNIPDEECVTTDDIRGQTNLLFRTNCTSGCIAELGYTIAITDWIGTLVSTLDLDFDGDIDLKDYYYLQQIRILQ